jgi:hypothetical protein
LRLRRLLLALLLLLRLLLALEGFFAGAFSRQRRFFISADTLPLLGC